MQILHQGSLFFCATSSWVLPYYHISSSLPCRGKSFKENFIKTLQFMSRHHKLQASYIKNIINTWSTNIWIRGFLVNSLKTKKGIEQNFEEYFILVFLFWDVVREKYKNPTVMENDWLKWWMKRSLNGFGDKILGTLPLLVVRDSIRQGPFLLVWINLIIS